MRRRCGSDPNFIEARCNLGNALQRAFSAITGGNRRIWRRRCVILIPISSKRTAIWALTKPWHGIPGRLPEAMAEYREALRIDPANAKVHNNLGNVLAKTPGRSSEAIAEYETALA